MPGWHGERIVYPFKFQLFPLNLGVTCLVIRAPLVRSVWKSVNVIMAVSVTRCLVLADVRQGGEEHCKIMIIFHSL